MNYEITKEDKETLMEIYKDIETDYKIRSLTSAIYNIEDPLKDKAYNQLNTLNRIFMFLRSPHA